MLILADFVVLSFEIKGCSDKLSTIGKQIQKYIVLDKQNF